jgi:hypothetical protein
MAGYLIIIGVYCLAKTKFPFLYNILCTLLYGQVILKMVIGLAVMPTKLTQRKQTQASTGPSKKKMKRPKTLIYLTKDQPKQ